MTDFQRFCKNIFYAFYDKKILYNPLRKKCPYSDFFWSVFSPYFPAFGLNLPHMEIYSVDLHIQSE